MYDVIIQQLIDSLIHTLTAPPRGGICVECFAMPRFSTPEVCDLVPRGTHPKDLLSEPPTLTECIVK